MTWAFVAGAIACGLVAAREAHRSLRLLVGRQGAAAAESAGCVALFSSLAFIFAVLGA